MVLKVFGIRNCLKYMQSQVYFETKVRPLEELNSRGNSVCVVHLLYSFLSPLHCVGISVPVPNSSREL